MNEDFKRLIDTLQDSIFTWEYFSDFEKVKSNVGEIERELSLLNTLIGKENIEAEFISLIEEYPKVREVLPILIAVRKNKISEMQIISDIKNWNPELREYLFYDDLSVDSKKELVVFFRESGLKKIFVNKNIKSLVDYVFGVEVGMDTNARKNRTGTLMEDIVEEYLADFCDKNDSFTYLEQATKMKIKNTWNYDIDIDKNNRRFDFAVFNTDEDKLYLFEVNYYSGGGSKLKSVAGEFQELHTLLKEQDLELFWITDGKGWLTTKNALEETFIKNDGNIYNIDMLKDGILDELLK